MYIFLYYGVAFCGHCVRILFAEEPELRVVVIPSGDGKNVRLLNESLITSGMETEYYINGSPSRLNTCIGYLCGKKHDSGIVTCTEQTEKSSFTIKNTEGGHEIVADNGQCLTKMGLDGNTTGYFINLKPCTGSSNQIFKVDSNDKDGTYLDNCYCGSTTTPQFKNSYINHSMIVGGPSNKYSLKNHHYKANPVSKFSRTFANYGGGPGSMRLNSNIPPGLGSSYSSRFKNGGNYGGLSLRSSHSS
jgi:hypothetical protein